MKLIHLSDLHLGKRLENYSFLEDQKYILDEILSIVAQEAPRAVLISGDIYDKSVPSAEAVELFDSFLCALSRPGLDVFILSGNHDSPERLAFGARLMDGSGVHLSPVYNGKLEPITLSDEYGNVSFYMLPFVKPVHVRVCFPEENVESYTDAVRTALKDLPRSSTERCVLLTHQFVTGAERCDSEDISVGGSDNVDVSVFDGIDYVALGHIHGPQNIGSQRVRYCGTPLKYSFSEVKHEKSVTVAELGRKGELTVHTVPLRPMREMRELRGSYDELTLRSFYAGTSYPEDYLRIILTDEDDIPDAYARLKVIYPYLVKILYDNTRTRHYADYADAPEVENKSPMELFEEFFLLQNGSSMSEEQRSFVSALIEEIMEDEA